MVGEENLPKRNKWISLIVNGKRVEAEVESRMTLAEFLREKLSLTGTKVGCNRAECGSCTVILDGNAVYSCTVLAVEATGREVVAVEGLEGDDKLHPLQAAFIEHDALQCGYCTPGMLMAGKALLQRKPNPTDEDINEALSGNLCRCGAYQEIRAAVKDAAKK